MFKTTENKLLALYLSLVFLTIAVVMGNVINEYFFKESAHLNIRPNNPIQCRVNYSNEYGLRISHKKGIQYETASTLQNP